MTAATPEISESMLGIALVTGAGSGIGREISRQLADAGYRLMLLGRTEHTLRETQQLLPSAGEDHLILPCDIADPMQARRAVERAVELRGRLDVLVNNAGLAEAAPIAELTQDLLDRLFAVNAFGPAHLIARAWPIFASQRSGCVVNVSTMSTIDPFPGLAAYAASKAALESLTRSILNEGHNLGIRAFTVAPGSVETPMLRGLVSKDELPTEHTLHPADVAGVVADCVLGRRDESIGQVIRVPSP